jgi:hypothetical protein
LNKKKASVMNDRRLEASVNQRPVSQAALNWLRQTDEPMDALVWYVPQLAFWALQNEKLTLRKPLSATQPSASEVDHAIGLILRAGEKEAAAAFSFLFSNPDLSPEEQEDSLEAHLDKAVDPVDAAACIIQTLVDRLQALNYDE